MSDFPRIELPEFKAKRGGFSFDPPTLAQRVAAEANRVAVDAMVRKFSIARNTAIDRAATTALIEGWDVHVYEPPEPISLYHSTVVDILRMRCIGIEFAPAKHPVPTIHYHQPPRDAFKAEMAWEDADLEHWLR